MEAKFYYEPIIDQPQSEKSLRDAFETLKSKVEKLKDLKEKSDEMVSRFYRDFFPTNKQKDKEEVIVPQKKDYIDLLYSTANDIEKYKDAIEKNIDEMINLIG